MAYTNLADQVELHRTDPDPDLKRRGTIDNILYTTREEAPGVVAGVLRKTAQDGVYKNPYQGLTAVKADGKRKLLQMANHLEGFKFVAPKRTSSKYIKKTRSQPVKSGKRR